MEVDPIQQNNFDSDDEENYLQNVITQKKRQYRLEIRKKKIQQVFNKKRILNNPGYFNIGQHNNEQQYNDQNGQNCDENNMIENIQNENQQQFKYYPQQLNFQEEYNKVMILINGLSKLVHNFDPNNMPQLESILQTILTQYLIGYKDESFINILKKELVHNSLTLILSKEKINVKIKYLTLWCLINLSCSQNDQYHITDKLVQQDIIKMLKSLLKDPNNSTLYETVIIDFYEIIYHDQIFILIKQRQFNQHSIFLVMKMIININLQKKDFFFV